MPPSPILIDDPLDPRIDAYLRVRERDLVGRDGRFLAEGLVVLRVLVRSRFEVESLLVAEARRDTIEELVAELPERVPLYLAPQRVMDAIAGFPMHRGVLAVARRGVEPSLTELLTGIDRFDATVVVCVGLSNHDNVGGIFRNAAAFGADAVLLDAESCDPLYRKAVRVSVGGALKVPFLRGPRATELLSGLAEAGFELVALSPGGTEELADFIPRGRVALLLGAEGPGLPESILQATRTVRIEMAPGFDSLNVAATSAVALHALGTARRRLVAQARAEAEPHS
jgi:tRNA G18 (ribose-2'-O)-methylase SpoU